MRMVVVKDKLEGSRVVSRIFAHRLSVTRTAVLGLATGSSPIPLYQILVDMYREGQISFEDVHTFNLDEYVPLGKDDPCSYHKFMHTQLFHHINLQSHHINLLDGATVDTDRECDAYEDAIRVVGGIDLQLLGIGQNGHIAFNEPGSSFHGRTHLVNLTQSTLDANQVYLSDTSQPTQALTMGIGTILDSKEIVVLAWGANKADACAKALTGVQSVDVPASALQGHPLCTWILDEDAASRLSVVERTKRSIWNTIAHVKPCRVLIFSPHPDDDVIAMGATMQALVSNGCKVTVAYQTSGYRGVPSLSRELATQVRRREAFAAVRCLGNIEIIFMDSKWYEADAQVEADDLLSHVRLLEMHKPDIVFVAKQLM